MEDLVIWNCLPEVCAVGVHKNRQIKNRTSDEKVIEKRRLKIKDEKKERKENENDDDDDVKKKGRKCMFILK